MNRRDDIVLRRGVVPRHEADAVRQEGERAFALRGEEPLAGKPPPEALQLDEDGAFAEGLDREHSKLERASRLPEVGTTVDVHAVAVCELQPQRIECRPRHRGRQRGDAVETLQREEHALPGSLAAQLGDLTLDPDGR